MLLPLLCLPAAERCTYCGREALTIIYRSGLPTPVCGAHAT